MELTTVQIIIIGFLATLLVQVIKLVITNLKLAVPSKAVVLWIVFGISLILSIVFLLPELKEASAGVVDPVTALDALVRFVPMIFGLMIAIYELFAKKVMEEWLKMDPEKTLAKKLAQ